MIYNMCISFEYQGSLEDEASLIEAIKQVDVVVSAVSSKQVLAQKLLISAIKQAGCIKVFLLSLPVYLFMLLVLKLLSIERLKKIN